MNQNQVAATTSTVASTETVIVGAGKTAGMDTTTPAVTEVAAPAAKKGKAKSAAKKTATKVVKPAKDKTATAAVAVPRTDTKKFKAIAIVTEGLAAGTARKEVLVKLQTELGLSAAGSNTYFQNCKSRKTGWTA